MHCLNLLIKTILLKIKILYLTALLNKHLCVIFLIKFDSLLFANKARMYELEQTFNFF